MLDTFYQWLLFVLPLVLAAALGLWPKRFETAGYRWAVVIFCVLFSAGAYLQMTHESRKAAADRNTAIKETAKQYADTVQSQALKIGELEGYIQSQGKDVRDVVKYTAANAARLNALWEETQTGKQKRQNVIDEINKRIDRGVWALSVCANVGPRGSGGVSLRQCVESADSWTSEATGLLYGSLGPLYVDRFMSAVPTQLGGPSHGSDPRLELDPQSFSQWSQTVHEMEGKVNVLKEFVKELAK
jgi:hypothetical protein